MRKLLAKTESIKLTKYEIVVFVFELPISWKNR